jgi:hypothetical protein
MIVAKRQMEPDRLGRRTISAGLLLMILTAGAAVAAPQCTLGTKSAPNCNLFLNSPVSAELELPVGYTGVRSLNGPSTYAGTSSCPSRYLVRLTGEGGWSRITIRPRGASGATELDPCDCANAEARVQVVSHSKYSGCEGGCADCSPQQFCADPGECYECSWTPVPFDTWPQAGVRATGTWVPAGLFTGPAHCELQVHVYRNTSSPIWKGNGGVVAAAVYDKRTGVKYPFTVEARNSANDPEPLGGGSCPHCSD